MEASKVGTREEALESLAEEIDGLWTPLGTGGDRATGRRSSGATFGTKREMERERLCSCGGSGEVEERGEPTLAHVRSSSGLISLRKTEKCDEKQRNMSQRSRAASECEDIDRFHRSSVSGRMLRSTWPNAMTSGALRSCPQRSDSHPLGQQQQQRAEGCQFCATDM